MTLRSRRSFLQTLPGFPALAALPGIPATPSFPLPQQPQVLRNVRSFGAVGNGTTDDTAAIQAALQAGDTVIPPGTYLITKTLTIKAPRTVWAQPGARLTKRAGARPFPALTAAAALGVVGLSIDGRDRGVEGNLGIAFSGQADDSRIVGCRFSNLQQGIQFLSGTSASRVTIEGNHFETCDWGVLIPSGGRNVTDDLHLLANTFFNISSDAVEVQATARGSSLARLQVIGNRIRRLTSRSVWSGFGIGVAGALLDGVPTVEGTIIAYNHIDGENNGADQGGHQGIHLEGQRRALILGNVICRVGDTGGSPEKNGIHCLTGNAAEAGLQVVGNSVTECTGHGIRLIGTATAQQPAIVGNVASGNGGTGIALGESSAGLLVGNAAVGNAGFGIALGGPTPTFVLATGNIATGNKGGDFSFPPGMLHSELSGNLGDTQDGAGVLFRRHGLLEAQGAGSPEGVVNAPVGSVYRRTDGGLGTSLYVKESGSGNTGWVAK